MQGDVRQVEVAEAEARAVFLAATAANPKLLGWELLGGGVRVRYDAHLPALSLRDGEN